MGENCYVIPRLMNLTAGTTLQNRKYVIQKQLHQSAVGVTYQARHAYLEQPVVLQTLSESLRQRSNFAQLRQQFLNKVRAIAQQPRGSLRVLDCFEEEGLPFVVFELASDLASDLAGALPQYIDWAPEGEPEAAAREEVVKAELNSAKPLTELSANGLGAAAQVSLSSQADMTQPEHSQPVPKLNGNLSGTDSRKFGNKSENPFDVAHLDLNDQTSEALAPVQSEAIRQKVGSTTGPTGPVASKSLATPAASPNGQRPQPAPQTALQAAGVPLLPAPSQPTRSWGGWMPVALLSTSLVAGLLGAGFGYLLRFSATTQSGPSRLAPRLFSREQSFPSEADWPISETPQTFSDPMPVETPVYRSTAPALPDYQPLPASNFEPADIAPLPVAPSAVPAPPSPAPIAPVPPAVPPAASEAPPQIGNAPPAPAPAPEPEPPVPEPPSAPAIAPPPAPPELPREPQILKN